MPLAVNKKEITEGGEGENRGRGEGITILTLNNK